MQPLALTLGEPAGIGPDLALSVWHRRSELDVPPFYLVADPDFLKLRAGQLGLDVPVAEMFPGLQVAVYCVIGEPPLLPGAVNATAADPEPAVAAPMVGGPGGVV